MGAGPILSCLYKKCYTSGIVLVWLFLPVKKSMSLSSPPEIWLSRLFFLLFILCTYFQKECSTLIITLRNIVIKVSKKKYKKNKIIHNYKISLARNNFFKKSTIFLTGLKWNSVKEEVIRRNILFQYSFKLRPSLNWCFYEDPLYMLWQKW